ncbi:hypothetical protein CBM2634_B60064 [Cupriavidus taiwanensis]|uniref:Uncharacterized protein n=1 Tax=Cupriavidus taiwanensis TaxID=164546 RepID=A0A375J940_9BURK|nr:hypothetical protein CBM2634_B60064 [Cupriavidus taiwanensis]
MESRREMGRCKPGTCKREEVRGCLQETRTRATKQGRVERGERNGRLLPAMRHNALIRGVIVCTLRTPGEPFTRSKCGSIGALSVSVADLRSDVVS